MLQTKQTSKGYSGENRKEKIGNYKIERPHGYNLVKAENFKNCDPLGIQKKNIEFIFIINIIIKISSEALI